MSVVSRKPGTSLFQFNGEEAGMQGEAEVAVVCVDGAQ